MALYAKNKDADNCTNNHDDHHDGSEIVARLLECLNRHSDSKQQINRDNCKPAKLGQIDRNLHANGKHKHEEHDSQYELFPAFKLEATVNPTKQDGNKGKENRDSTCGSTGVGLGYINGSFRCVYSLEGICHHIDKSSDNNNGEQPAEQQEQTTASTANVLLNKLSK